MARIAGNTREKKIKSDLKEGGQFKTQTSPPSLQGKDLETTAQLFSPRPNVAGSQESYKDENKKDLKEDFSEEEERGYQLDPKQKLQVLGIILSSFLLFGLFFFPYQKLARYFFFSFANQISLGAGQVELNFLSSSFIDDINFSFGTGGGVSARQLKLDIPLLKLMGSSLDGGMQFKEMYYFSKALSLSAYEAILSLNIKDRSMPPNQWQGNIELETRRFKLLELNIPQLESIGVDLSQMKVQKFELKLSFEQGNLGFGGSQLLSNYFTVNLKGFAQLKEQVASSPLNAEICIVPSPELESLDNKLMGLYILAGGTAEGELCIKVRGQLQKPDFEKVNTGLPPEGREQPNTVEKRKLEDLKSSQESQETERTEAKRAEKEADKASPRSKAIPHSEENRAAP